MANICIYIYIYDDIEQCRIVDIVQYKFRCGITYFFWDIARLYFVCKCKNCRSRDMIEWNKRCVKNVGQYLNILSTNTNYTILYVCFSSLTKVVNHLTSTLQCRINFIFVTPCIFALLIYHFCMFCFALCFFVTTFSNC